MKHLCGAISGFILIMVIQFAVCSNVVAQNVAWSRTYGGLRNDGAFAVIQTRDGGIVTAGFSSSFSGNNIDDIYLLKTDMQGNQIWSRTYGGGLQEIATDIKQTSDGGFIVSGYKQISNVNDPFLMKTDSAGNVIWERTYDYGLGMDDRAHAVCQTADGGYIFAGQTRIVDQFPHYEMYLVRTDPAGNPLWMRIYGYTPGTGNDVGLTVIQLSDGGFVAGGFTQSSIWSSYVQRLTPAGDVMWTKVRPNDYQSECYNVIATLDGNLMITGTSVSFTTDTDVLIEKLDMNGNSLWEKIYGGVDAETGQSIKELASGGYVLSGMAATQSTSWDMYVMQVNASGDSVWSRKLGGSSDDRGWAVETTGDGHLLSAGWVYSFGAGGGDLFLAKMSLQGISAISDPSASVNTFELHQNYPNPFNPSTSIRFEIISRGFVDLSVFNSEGRKVDQLMSEVKSPGNYEIKFNAEGLPGGVYFCRLTSGSNTVTRKMLLIK